MRCVALRARARACVRACVVAVGGVCVCVCVQLASTARACVRRVQEKEQEEEQEKEQEQEQEQDDEETEIGQKKKINNINPPRAALSCAPALSVFFVLSVLSACASYTSLIQLDASSFVVTYDLIKADNRSAIFLSASFSMAVHLGDGDDDAREARRLRRRRHKKSTTGALLVRTRGRTDA